MNNYNFATANLSFAFALGKKIGSEKKWLEKIAEYKTEDESDDDFLKNKAEYTMKKIVEEFTQKQLDAIGLQELNGYDNPIGIKTFEKEFRKSELDNDFRDVERDAPSENVEVNIKGIEEYCIISFGVKLEHGVPTVALIYNTERLGIPKEIFCEDCVVAGQNGRPMLGVITNMGFGLISMHAPNVNPYLLTNKNTKLRTLMDGEKMQNYFKGLTGRDIVSAELSEINWLINSEFMSPMVNKITSFIGKLKSRTNKIVLMGDMNDPYPREQSSLSNKLMEHLGLQFSPGEPTCCYNWDSSKIDDDIEEYTNWIFGRSHPDDKLNEQAINEEAIVAHVKNIKSQKKNYVFTGDLIYFTNEFRVHRGMSQVELFPQSDDNKTSQYSDHVFQKITLELNPELSPPPPVPLNSTDRDFGEGRERELMRRFLDDYSAGGSKKRKKHSKSKKKRKSTKKKRPTKRRRPTKRKRAGKSFRTR